MRYTIDQIKTALRLLKTAGFPNKVIELLGYPSNPMLYHWRDKYSEYYDTPIQKNWKQAPLELKRNTIERCTIGGESVKSVAEDIGYSPSLIYKWLRDYQKKGCSPDNSACEGFFDHFKTEMFYGRNWDEYTLTEFIKEVDAYMHCYCKDRIKTTLEGICPLEYRRRIGVAV